MSIASMDVDGAEPITPADAAPSSQSAMDNGQRSANGPSAVNGAESAHGLPDTMEVDGEETAPEQSSKPEKVPEAAAVTPEQAEEFKAQGNQFYKAGKYAKAIELYSKGLSLGELYMRLLTWCSCRGPAAVRGVSEQPSSCVYLCKHVSPCAGGCDEGGAVGSRQ
jgi:hypothetical protein